MIMMPYSWRWSSLQFTGQTDFWHPTGQSHSRSGDEHRAPQKHRARRIGLSAHADFGECYVR
jgi:hypothetical protein